MKIAQISTPHIATPPAGFGASELVAGLLAESLAKRGHEVTLYAHPDSQPPPSVRFVSFPEACSRESADDKEREHVERALRDATGFDVVHNHCLTASGVVANSPVPAVTTLHYYHDSVTTHPDGNYVAVSKNQRKYLNGANVVATVYNGIDVTQYRVTEEKDDYLLFLGRFTPKKAPHIAIEVAKRLGRRLIIAAPLPPLDQLDYFNAFVKPHLEGNIEYIKEVFNPHKAELLGRACCVLVPLGWEEPFGLVMAEAQASGTAVIAYRRGAAPEVIEDGVTGFLVDSVDEMVDAVGRVGDISPQACRRRVERLFTTEKMVDGYVQVYSDLVARQQRTEQEPERPYDIGFDDAQQIG